MAVSNANNGENDGRFSVDIRVFVGCIMACMAVSFSVGVGLGPSTQDLIQAKLVELQVLQESSGLPKVTSVDFGTPHATITSASGGTSTSTSTSTSNDPQQRQQEQEHSQHEPAGQHLLVDIKGIEADFLDSEQRLSTAMVDTVEQSGLTLLSYHCHKLIPKGVSCVGVLLESHISFHTWPDEGVITLDLFTCGNKPLIPAVGILKQLFGIPRAPDSILVQWSHELRGFRNKHTAKATATAMLNDGSAIGTGNYAVLDHNSDLSQMVWSPIDCLVKEQVVSTLTKYQRVDIWDLVGLEETPSYQDALKHNLQPGDPRWTTAELVSPTRHLFLDGVLQSESSSHVEYHEAMVHPAMFAHPNPQHVAIVGGGEGATLREVLKHKTVEQVTMIEIDKELVDLVKIHMPYFSDCTPLMGRANDCFQDSAAKLVIQDATDYFQQRVEQVTAKTTTTPALDVVIIDGLEPEMGAPIAKSLYDKTTEDVGTLENILDSLTDDGVLLIQIGRAPTILDPRPDIGFNAPRERLFQTLEHMKDKVAAMFVYEDAHCGFDTPRAFLLVCKSVTCRERFYTTADEMDYLIYDRIVKTTTESTTSTTTAANSTAESPATSSRALKYFDGVTHLGYQVAPKAWETIYCRREPTPFECAYRHLDFSVPLMEYNMENEAEGAFTITADYAPTATTTEAEAETEGKPEEPEITQTHVWANVDIPKGAYIMPEHLASSLQLSHPSIANLRQNLEYGGVSIIEDFVEFVEDHGHESQAAGSGRRLVEVGASYMIRSVEEESEANVGRWIPAHPEGQRPIYSPVYERHRLSFDVFIVATQDIPKGTELKRWSHMWEAP